MARTQRISVRSFVTLTLVSVLGLAMFTWPLLLSPDSALSGNDAAPYLFAVTLAMLMVVVLGEVSRSGLDSKSLAILGVLAAVASVLRPLGAGVTGFQPMFVVLLLGGRVLGPGFGFALGLVSLLGSALITGGIGPWLPFQMLGAAWFAMGAGLLPPLRGKWEVVLLAGYGAIAGIVYGWLLNLWFWPTLTDVDSSISYVAGAPLLENLTHFLAFNLLTSFGFDLPRAIGTAVLVIIVGAPLLRVLRRAARKANFGAQPVFTDSSTRA